MNAGPAKRAHLPAILDLLEAAQLPTSGVEAILPHLLVIEENGVLVGVGGLEPHGDDALIRSVVVAAAQRGRGVASTLCDALESAAARSGARALYLLTDTAAGFFARRGYRKIARTDAPAAIRASEEFASLCGPTAVPMTLVLVAEKTGQG
ncbi:MAG TPA: arsenic resistance N-acetyltransferase ArsN2 [Planctomycetota bacterium]